MYSTGSTVHGQQFVILTWHSGRNMYNMSHSSMYSNMYQSVSSKMYNMYSNM